MTPYWGFPSYPRWATVLTSSYLGLLTVLTPSYLGLLTAVLTPSYLGLLTVLTPSYLGLLTAVLTPLLPNHKLQIHNRITQWQRCNPILLYQHVILQTSLLL